MLYLDNLVAGGSGESLYRVLEARPELARSVTAFARRGYLSPAFDRLLADPPPRYLRFRPWVSWGPSTPRLRELAAFGRGALLQVGALAALLRLARLERVQLVHTNCVYLIEGALVARALGLPHVWQVRELLDLDYYRYAIDKRTILSWVSRLSEVIVCASRRLANGLASVGADPQKLRVVPNAVPSPKARDLHALLGVSPSVRLIGLVGWITPNKAVEDFIDVASRFAAREDVRFVVIGGFGHRTEYNQKIEAAIAQSKNRARIILTGVLEDAAAYMPSLTALITPCWTESFGRSVAEALAAGTPAIGVRGSAVDELIDEGETGYLVKAHDVDAMEARTRGLLDDPALRQRMGNEARQRSSRFSPARVASELETLYAELLTDRRGQTS